MAQLNLRDRLVETTIAYVGSVQEDGVANFAHLAQNEQQGRAGKLAREVVDGARLVTVEWRPREGAKLNDCELTVRLVAPEGPPEPKVVERVLADADGLVLMLEAEASAAERNRAVVATVRDALARTPSRQVPVVVQVNQREGDEGHGLAVPAGVESWPRVPACAAKGDGVMETLRRAVDEVVESMQSRGVRPPANGAPVASRVEGNPLLAALRQVLQATLSEQMAGLEARLVERLEARVGAHEEPVRALAERLVGVEARVERAAEGVERLEAMLDDLLARVSASSEAASRDDLEQLEARLALGASSRRDAVLAELKEYRRGLRDEAARALSATQLAQKLGEALMGEVKALNGEARGLSADVRALGTELKKSLPTDVAARLAGAFDRVGAKVEDIRAEVESFTRESRAATGRAVERVDAVAVELRKLDLHVGREGAETRESVRTLGAQREGHEAEVQKELGALAEEIRRKRKSWFA